MKRITSVVLAVCMLLSVMLFASCAQETPASLVNGAMEKMAELDSMEAKVDAEIKMSMLGIDLAMPIDMHMVLENAKSTTPVASLEAEMSMMGESVSMNMYLDGQGWAYITMDGEGYKVNTADAMEQLPLSTDNVTDMITQFPEELFEGAQIVNNEDGSKSVSLAITPEMYAQLFGDALDGLASSMGAAVTLKDISLEITVKDGYVVEYDIEFDMDMNVEGISVSASMDMDIDYINPGKAVKVTPPAGYENFPVMGE